jgi:tRNA(adenine34) deaminase
LGTNVVGTVASGAVTATVPVGVGAARGLAAALDSRASPPPTATATIRAAVDHFFPRDEYFMALALREAERAEAHGDVPVGALVVRDGEVIGVGHNERELRKDPTAHAEILALREASTRLGSWRVLDSVMYVTLEPCSMCAGAIVLARIPRVVYAAPDPKAGAAGSVLNLLDVPQFNHRPIVAGGLLAEESAALLRAFFASRRGR